MAMIDHALEYCKMGFSVVPLKKDKLPHIAWEPYQTRKAEPLKIKQWWAKWPDANIGIVTGKVSGLVVIDCDSRGAMKKAMSFVRQNIMDKIPLVSTAKGFHLYFRHPGNGQHVGNRGDLFKDEKNRVDVRGDNGYIVAPPSIHASGRRYAWASLATLADRPDLPPELLMKITTNDDGEIRKPPVKKSKKDVKPLFEATVPSRSIDKKTGKSGKPHTVKLMPSGNWRCSCLAFLKGHNECWALKQERTAWEEKHAGRVHK